MTEVRGIPDFQAQPTTLLNWQSQTALNCQAGATGTWDCDICCLTDPSHFAHVIGRDSIGSFNSDIVNLQLGNTIATAVAELTTNAKAWRVAYMSVTIYQDGPALSNQGTVVAAQYPMAPQQVFYAALTPATGIGYLAGGKIVKYEARDVPAYDRLQNMPNAYFGRSADGVYMPIKLDPAHVAWRTPADRVLEGSAFPTAGTGFTVPQAAAAPSAGFPYGASAVQPCFYNTATVRFEGNRLIGPLTNNVGGICFKNLAVTTGLSVVIRMGLEVQAHAGSIWGPYLKLAPPTDTQALLTYYAISRELKDAYPEDFNSLAKLWGVIKNAAKVVAPALSFLGPVGQAIHAGGSLVGGIVDSISNHKEDLPKHVPRELNLDSPPAAAVERAREVAHLRNQLSHLRAAKASPVTAKKKKLKRRARTG